MTVTDLGDFYMRNKPIVPPTGKTQVQGTGARVADGSKVDKTSPLYAQCSDFESIFVKMMVKEMRSSIDKSGLISGGWAEDIFQDMLDDNYSKTISKTAGLGIADQLYKQLSKYA
jgi:Rod binding domain-containing protein